MDFSRPTVALGRGRWLRTVANLCMLGLAVCAASGARASVVIDPDAAADGQDISSFFSAQGVTLSNDGADPKVYARDDGTGNKTFAWMNQGYLDSHWARSESPNLQADFSFLASSASINVLSDNNATLFAYDASNNLLGSATRPGGFTGGTLSYTAGGDLIQRIVVDLGKGHGADFGTLDHLVVDTGTAQSVPEPGSLVFLAVAGLPMVGSLRRKTHA